MIYKNIYRSIFLKFNNLESFKSKNQPLIRIYFLLSVNIHKICFHIFSLYFK